MKPLELWIFSFNSYVYYLTRDFIASTHAFNLLNRAFYLPTRSFNILTRGFELVTPRFEHVTRISELVTRNSLLSFHFPTYYLYPFELLISL